MRPRDIKKPPAGWRPRRGKVSMAYPCAAYGGLGLGPAKPACCRENISIIPQERTVCKGVIVWRRH